MLVSQEARIEKGDVSKVLGEMVRSGKYKDRFRAIITSPPYFQCRTYGRNSKEIGREETVNEYLLRLAHVFSTARDLLTKDGTIWIVIADVREKGAKLNIPHRLTELMINSGYLMQADIAWYKKNHIAGSSKQNFTSAYESILVFSKQANSSIGNKLDHVDGVWNIPTKSHSAQGHYAIYPEELVEKIIDFSTKKNDWVCDPFAGRGTTGIVCTEKKRKFVGIDLYANHVRIASRNIETNLVKASD